MPRPPKWKYVSSVPDNLYFVPVGRQTREEVCISIEEIETIRLKDLEGLDQEEAGVRMRVSRPTFHRLLEGARKKLADALLNGKAICIRGGKYRCETYRFICKDDGYEWHVPLKTVLTGHPGRCPRCRGTNIQAKTPMSDYPQNMGQKRRRFGASHTNKDPS